MLITGKVVPPARLELALPKEPDFESGASTNSTTGAYIFSVLSDASHLLGTIFITGINKNHLGDNS